MKKIILILIIHLLIMSGCQPKDKTTFPKIQTNTEFAVVSI